MSPIVNFLNQEKAKVVSPSELKVGRKAYTAIDFYKLHLLTFETLGVNLSSFEKELSEIYKNQVPAKYSGPGALESLLLDLNFIADKFRWFITEDSICVYYAKCRLDAEEYKFLTTDPQDLKFFNEIPIEEIEILSEYLKVYNASNEPLQEEKVVFLLISKLRKSRYHQLRSEPVTLTNDPTKPAFKYFDIKGIVLKGLKYMKENNNERPPTPAWDSFFKRIRNQKMVGVTKAYLAGLFIEQNTTKQALYIYGTGNDGKTQVTSALVKFMGHRVTFPLPQNMKSNQFTLSAAHGKRMFIGEELQSPNVIRTGLLHAILGGSIAWIEHKNERAFMSKVYACGVITSNYLPEIADVKNQKCRLLYIEMNSAAPEEIQAAGKTWSENLVSEMDSLIFNGLDEYRKLNLEGAEFKTPEDYADDLSYLFDEKSELINSFVSEVFVSDPTSYIRDKLKGGLIQYVKNNHPDIQYLKDFTEQSLNKEILEKLTLRYPGVERIRITWKGNKIPIIKGLRVVEKFNSLSNVFDFEE